MITKPALKKFALYTTAILCAAIGSVGCGSSVEGPCVHTYVEPVFGIDAAQDAKTGRDIPAVVLFDITIDSISAAAGQLTLQSERVSYLDSMLICNPPCAFGTDKGVYGFRVSAHGYRDTVITAEAAYSISNGGCPSSSNGGTRITIAMEPL